MSEASRVPRTQWIVLGAIFAVVVALLGLGYYLFLRTDYVVLVQGLRPADASAIVAELDKRGEAYRLADGGGTILVPEGQADATRVAIAGSDAAAHGQIGFELFNKSDMGLTNFAQKINYQRALQGELVRTITLMDGVDSARVHLALPERTLFRGDRQEPKAAVTVAMKPGQTADPARVKGIQELVAAAVPDLPEAKVVVLDSGGRVISPEVVAESTAERPADLEEKAAVEGYYRARARGAIERALPGVKFALRVLVLPIGMSPPAAPVEGGGDAAAPDWTPSGEGAGRNYRLRFLFVTEAALPAEEQNLVREAIGQTAALNADLGDSLLFETGPVDPVPAVAQPAPASLAPAVPAPDPTPAATPWQWPGLLLWGLAGLAVLGLILWLVRRSARPRLDNADHDAFAARLRRQLNLEDSDAIA